MAEPSVDPLVPHLFLSSLTLFSSPSPLPSPPWCFNSMALMDSVVHHDLFDHLFDGLAAVAALSDRIGIGWAPALRHGYIWHGCRWWACRSIVLAPLGSIVIIINQGVRYLSGLPIPPQSTPCVYEQHRMATSSACLYRPHMPPLTHWPSPIRLEHSDVEGARAPSPATRTSSTLPWPSPPLTPSCLTSSF